VNSQARALGAGGALVGIAPGYGGHLTDG
jgi:hypothetical protein